MSESPVDGWDKHSMWAEEYNITPFRTDAAHWHKDWEKLLPTLSASRDVFPTMRQFFRRPSSWTEEETFARLEAMSSEVAASQERLLGVWPRLIDDGEFVTAWYLLEEKHRRRHVSNGIEEICQYPFGQDSRSLCPEVSFTFMLKQKGRVFVDFLNAFTLGKEKAGEGKPYFVPSTWWDEAAELSDSEEKESRGSGSGNDDEDNEDVEEEEEEEDNNSDAASEDSDSGSDSDFADSYQALTLHRNETICEFLKTTIRSVLDDMDKRAPGMDSVMQFMESHGSWADTIGRVSSQVRDKPLIRCENCTMSSEELGDKVKFMVCSQCKAKLDFVLHYCSQKCQKEDWRNHRKHCGKDKVSKKLPGTAHDPFWYQPALPDHLRRTFPAAMNGSGGMVVTDLGFADPLTAPSYSPPLRRQVSLLTADKEADYFLFDQEDRPVRLVVDDQLVKLNVRIMRAGLFASSTRREEVVALAQYLIKVMSGRPGLSKTRILAQLTSEYEMDISGRLISFERALSVNRNYVGTTFLEASAKNLLPMAGL